MNEHKSPIPSRIYNAAVGGHVTGADQIIDDKTGLTLDKVAGGALEEKTYISGSDNGMGRIVLRKNLVNGVNTLTQNMINKSNTIYVIQYDFDLNGQEITIPEGCILDFKGGNLSNGTIVGNNTKLTLNNNIIFDNIILQGTFLGKGTTDLWSSNSNDNIIFKSLISSFKEVKINKNLEINNPIFITNKNKLSIDGNNKTIFIDCSNRVSYILYLQFFKYIEIKNICFDYKNTFTDEDIFIMSIKLSNIDNLIINNVIIQNYGNKENISKQYGSFEGIHIVCDKGNKCHISNCSFKNCIGVGGIDISDNKGIVYPLNISCHTDTNYGIVDVINCTFENIYCFDTLGNYIIDDTTPLYFQGVSTAVYDKEEDAEHVVVRDCNFYNVCKRGIKVQCNNIFIDNIYVDSKILGNSFIDVQGNNARISNVKGYYNGMIANLTRGHNIYLDKINVECTSFGVYTSGTNNTVITNSTIKANIIIGTAKIEDLEYINPIIKIDNCNFESKEDLFTSLFRVKISNSNVYGEGLCKDSEWYNCNIKVGTQREGHHFTPSATYIKLINCNYEVITSVSSMNYIFNCTDNGKIELVNSNINGNNFNLLLILCIKNPNITIINCNINITKDLIATAVIPSSGKIIIRDTDISKNRLPIYQSVNRLELDNVKTLYINIYEEGEDNLNIYLLNGNSYKIDGIDNLYKYLSYYTGIKIGNSSTRPKKLTNNSKFRHEYFDTELNKLIYWTGSEWVDAIGTNV